MACISRIESFHVVTVWFLHCCIWFSITSENREKGYFDMNLLVNPLILKVLDLF